MRDYLKLLFLLVLIVGAASWCAAQAKPDDLWRAARDAYLKGDVQTSVSLFEQYLSAFPSSHAAMYNLGNCYLQDGAIGKAILWFERARQIKPHDPDVLHNLAIARAKMENPIIEIQEFFAMRWIRDLSGRLSVGMWGILSVVLFWVTIVISAQSIRLGSWGKRKWIAILFVCGLLIALILGVQRHHDLHRNEVAIVLLDEALVNIAPDSGSKLVAKVGPGEKVVIIDSLDTFYKVRLANFEQGWISADGVERI